MKKLHLSLLLLAVFFAGCSDAITDSESEDVLNAPSSVYGETAVYQVAVRNLTTGQPFTPPLVATHNSYIDMYSVGSEASEGIKEIAENGNLGPLLDALENSDNVADVVVAVDNDVPPLLPGETVKFEITTSGNKHYLSFASMLICTNDGFTGLDSVKLPRYVGEDVGFELFAYDAGTEINTEDYADIVPPCQALVGPASEDEGTGMSNPDLAEGGVISPHPNVQGGNDLIQDVHGWKRNRVGKVRIRKIN